MTTYYVSSSGSNTSPYENWTKAATDIETIRALMAAGDTCYVENTYSKEYAADKTWTDAGTVTQPCIYISSTTGDVYTSGAELKATGSSYDLRIEGGNQNWYGFKFEADTGMTWGTSGTLKQFFDCTFTFTTGNPAFPNSYEAWFYNSTFVNDATSYVFYPWTSVVMRFIGCTINAASLGAGDSLIFYNSSASGHKWYFESCDLTNGGANTFDYVITGTGNNFGQYIFRNCRIPSGMAFSTDVCFDVGALFQMEGCYSGTDTVPSAWRLYQEERGHTTEAVDTEYRTGGASDSETNYSWEITPSTNIGFGSVYRSPPISRWVQAGSQTITIYFASGSSLNDDDIWVEVSTPSEAATAVALHKYQTTMDLLAGSACTTDSSSTWNGTGVGTKQKIEVTINPTEAGLATVRVCLAKNQTVFVDPIIG